MSEAFQSVVLNLAVKSASLPEPATMNSSRKTQICPSTQHASLYFRRFKEALKSLPVVQQSANSGPLAKSDH